MFSHIKPCQDHSTASLSRSVKDLLDPRKVAGYRRYDDTTIPVRNGIQDGISHFLLTSNLNLTIRIGRINTQEASTPHVQSQLGEQSPS